MLPKNMRSKDMAGMEVKTARAIKNGAGIVVPKGKAVRIASFGRSFTIRTEDCPHCGLSAYISGVTRDDVELISESDTKKTNADRIREMTNEELAEFVLEVNLKSKELCKDPDCFLRHKDCKDCFKEWLESECDTE